MASAAVVFCKQLGIGVDSWLGSMRLVTFEVGVSCGTSVLHMRGRKAIIGISIAIADMVACKAKLILVFFQCSLY